MPDKEKVIKGLEICTKDIPMSNAVHKDNLCKECPYYNAEYSYCFNQTIMMRDALALLKEQENEIADKEITVDVSIPEQFWPSMQYDPSEDVVACTSCLICGKDIPLRRYESGPRVCSECKKAVTAMKRGD